MTPDSISSPLAIRNAAIEEAAKWHEAQKRTAHCGDNYSTIQAITERNALHDKFAAAIRALATTPAREQEGVVQPDAIDRILARMQHAHDTALGHYTRVGLQKAMQIVRDGQAGLTPPNHPVSVKGEEDVVKCVVELLGRFPVRCSNDKELDRLRRVEVAVNLRHANLLRTEPNAKKDEATIKQLREALGALVWAADQIGGNSTPAIERARAALTGVMNDN